MTASPHHYLWRVTWRRSGWAPTTESKSRLFLDEHAARRFAARLCDHAEAARRGLTRAHVRLDRRPVGPAWTTVGAAGDLPPPPPPSGPSAVDTALLNLRLELARLCPDCRTRLIGLCASSDWSAVRAAGQLVAVLDHELAVLAAAVDACTTGRNDG